MKLPRLMTLAFALAGEDAPKAPPTEFRLFKAGENTSEKGLFIFDDESAKSVMEYYQLQGLSRLAIDYEHKSLNDDASAEDQKAAGWFTPEVRNGELWATAVKWAPKATQEIVDGEREYYSPAFYFDQDTRKILSLTNCAITNNPALHGIGQLMAASARVGKFLASSPRFVRLSGRSFGDIFDAVCKALRAEYLQRLWYIKEMFDDHVIVEFEDVEQLLSVPYTLDTSGKCTLGTPVEVEEQYVPVASTPSTTPAQQAGTRNSGNSQRGAAAQAKDNMIDFEKLAAACQACADACGACAAACKSQDEAKATEALKAFADNYKLAMDACGVNDKDPAVAAEAASARAGVGHFLELSGRKTIPEALGTLSAWRTAAESLPAVQTKLAELLSAARKAEIDKVLEGASKKFTPAQLTSLRSAREYRSDEDVAWLRAHVEATPVNPVLAATAIKTPAPPTTPANASTPTGKTWENLSGVEKQTLFHSDRPAYEALKADYQRRAGKAAC